MKRAPVFFLLSALACAAGILGGSLATGALPVRSALGELCGRGKLVALVGSKGIYEQDIQYDGAADLYLAGRSLPDDGPLADPARAQAIERCVAAELIDQASTLRPVPEDTLQKQSALLRDQWNDDALFTAALRTSGLTRQVLESLVARHLRSLAWIESTSGGAATVSEEEARRYYDDHVEGFRLPARIRASHVFLAAPEGTAADAVEQKRALIRTLAMRLRHGEPLAALAGAFSEDEATKKRGGDLNYFAADRMPPDFFAAVAGAQRGQVIGPIQTSLGFHIVEITDVKPPETLGYDGARAEIETAMIDRERLARVGNLVNDLGRSVAVRRR